MNEYDNIDFEILGDDITTCNFSFKIIIIGDQNVGKSSITLRGAKNLFNELYTPTVGFEFITFNVRINGQIVKLQIWDTCGQERYRSLISSFYRNSCLAIIVYSIDCQNSFDNVDEWIDEIKSQTNPNIKIFLIGNKKDLENKRCIDKNIGEQIAKEHNLDFFMETSAKTGENTQKLFVVAAKILVDEYKRYQNESDRDKSSVTLTAENKEVLEETTKKPQKSKCFC
jgi:Ras-related protein Rab-6A